MFNPFGGNSSSSAQATNQQVGAEGNSGPVFGAITIKGNSAKSSNTKAPKSSGATQPGKGVKKMSGAVPVPTASQTTSSASGQQTAGSGAGNLSIAVTSSDVNADDNLAAVATTAIGENTELAGYSIAAQNALASQSNTLALTALNGEQAALSATLDFAANNNASTAGTTNGVLQAGADFAALNAGADPNSIVAPVSQGNSKTTNLLLIASIAVTVILILKK